MDYGWVSLKVVELEYEMVCDWEAKMVAEKVCELAVQSVWILVAE